MCPNEKRVLTPQTEIALNAEYKIIKVQEVLYRIKVHSLMRRLGMCNICQAH